MLLAWLTDIHLNFIKKDQRRQFLKTLQEKADAVAISGDIGESHNVAQFLLDMDEIIQKPIYFVLGNHDFYRGSIKETRQQIVRVATETKHLRYLTAMGVIELSPQTAMIGHDGWADGRFGDYQGTEVILNDHLLIAELAQWFRHDRLDKIGLSKTLTTLADEAAQHFERVLGEAVTKYSNVIAVTHVPPFREAAWYQGKISNDDFLPYFACKIVGDVLKKVMQANPQAHLLVLCGHTHGGGEVQVLPNLRVLTGAAEYGKLAIERVLEVSYPPI
jgi:3',5'-cyclic-AMP phosphodiesterase